MASQTPASLSAIDIMVTRLVTLRPETDVFDGIKTLVKHKISGAPVVDSEGKLLGVFSEKSCMQVLIDAAYEGLPTNQIRAFMDPEPRTIEANTSFLTIAEVFLNTPRRRLPVIDADGMLIGQVSRRDVIKATSKLILSAPDHASTLLYLSALREMTDPPAV